MSGIAKSTVIKPVGELLWPQAEHGQGERVGGRMSSSMKSAFEESIKIFDLPDGVDISEIEDAIEKLVEAKRKSDLEHTLVHRILTSDEAMYKWADRFSGHRGRPVAITRAASYGTDPIEFSRELLFNDRLFSSRHNDPRRPVIMRGSLACMIPKYALYGGYSANGYVLEVFERYMRRIKFTSFDKQETSEKIKEVFLRLGGKFRTSYHLKRYQRQYHLEGVLTEDENAEWNRCHLEAKLGLAPVWVWIGGKQRRLTFWQFKYLRELHNIAQTAKTSADRRAVVKARMAVNRLSDNQRSDLRRRVNRRAARAAQRNANYVTAWQRQKMMLRIAKELLSIQNIDIERVYEDAARKHQI